MTEERLIHWNNEEDDHFLKSAECGTGILQARALESCKQGKITEDLRKLYLSPVRETIPWHLFPSWAQPSNWALEDAGVCHEG
jgi:hypothetical protein